MKRIGFDNEAYLKRQAEGLMQRAASFGNKLYLEFGGKLMYDYHAARVLPGYDPNVKLRLLRSLGDKAEIILCVYAEDIERKKMRADFGISYDDDALKLIDSLRSWDIHVCAVVITRYDGQPAAMQFKNKLEARGITVKLHRAVPGYPSNLDLVVSPDGYGANDYVETTRPIVVVTGPGPGSGKLATCLTMLYHDRTAGRNAGYAKFETFPVWDLPLRHPVNLAYEAATADLGDINMIDPFHLEAYGKATVNYNRDVEAFPLLREIWTRLDKGGECPYRSPTDMGVNCISAGIIDDEICTEAARQEIIRRYFRHLSDAVAKGASDKRPVELVERLMRQLGLAPEDRPTVVPARQAAHAASLSHTLEGVACGAAIELPDGTLIQGKNSANLHAAAATVLNAAKHLANIPDERHLLAPETIASVKHMKQGILKGKYGSLNLDETLVALAICAATDPNAKLALEKLADLRDCEMHLSHMLTPGDEAGLRRLGIRATNDPLFATAELFVDA
ncbi:MAG: DUF1846 domain-containing protein [Candidatus Spyradenecus sp.]